MNRLKNWLLAILFLLVIVGYGRLYYQYEQHQTLEQEILVLQEELKKNSILLSEAENKILQLEKESLEGILRETNKSIISGLNSLLDSVEDEFKKAKESLQEELTPNTENEAIEPENSTTENSNTSKT